jgi:hypothetical protein
MSIRPLLAFPALLCLLAAGSVQAEVITVRSGQNGGSPGLAGMFDDTVRFLNNNPAGAPISAVPFTPADFSGSLTGGPAQVINPVGVWAPGISDVSARWLWGLWFKSLRGSVLRDDAQRDQRQFQH